MDDSGVQDSLISVKAAIAEHPYSPATKNLVERTLEKELQASALVRGFTVQEFLNLVRLSIVATGYSKAGITNVRVLDVLAETVPEDLNAETFFPEIDENGRRNLWQYVTAARDAKELCSVLGKTHEFTVWHDFGMYAMFVSGIFPDVLLSRKKSAVGVPYYERTGSEAFKFAAKTGKDVDVSVFLDLARNFTGYRRVLNVAGSLIGTPAARTVARDIIESYELKAQVAEKQRRPGIDNILLTPTINQTGFESKPSNT